MKIFIAANNDAGLYKFRRELLEALVAEHSVTICLPDGEYVADMIKMGCAYERCEFDRHGMNPIKEFKLLRYYWKKLRQNRPDIVLSYTVKPNIYAGIVCSLLKIPYIANITGLGVAIHNGGFRQRVLLWLYRRGLNAARRVYFQNSSDMEFMVSQGIVTGEAELLPGSGVNLSQHCYEPYPDDSGEIILLVIGRIMRDKGSDEVLYAAGKLADEREDVSIRLIGTFDGDYQNKVEEAVKAGHIAYYGFQDDVHSFLRDCHGVLHASYHEGMSNVLLEAAAVGRPVIATNVPGCRETYEDGVSGISFKPRDGEDLLRAVKAFASLSADQRREMGIAGRQKIEKEFDRRIIVEKYIAEINNTKKDHKNGII